MVGILLNLILKSVSAYHLPTIIFEQNVILSIFKSTRVVSAPIYAVGTIP